MTRKTLSKSKKTKAVVKKKTRDRPHCPPIWSDDPEKLDAALRERNNDGWFPC